MGLTDNTPQKNPDPPFMKNKMITYLLKFSIEKINSFI